jgi:hypothetical protein
MDPVKDASHLYEVERRASHAARPGFRINELQISPQQKVPWHDHSNIQDTFYVLEGRIKVFLRAHGGDAARARRHLHGQAAPPAPRREWRRHFGNLPCAPGHRRIRFRSTHIVTVSYSGAMTTT